MFDMKNLFGHLKDFQSQISDLKDEIKGMSFSAETGGGMVKATVNGEGELVDLKLDPSLLKPEELSVLPQLIKTAVKEAQQQSKGILAEKIKEMTGGLSIPGLDQFIK